LEAVAPVRSRCAAPARLLDELQSERRAHCSPAAGRWGVPARKALRHCAAAALHGARPQARAALPPPGEPAARMERVLVAPAAPALSRQAGERSVPASASRQRGARPAPSALADGALRLAAVQAA